MELLSISTCGAVGGESAEKLFDRFQSDLRTLRGGLGNSKSIREPVSQTPMSDEDLANFGL